MATKDIYKVITRGSLLAKTQTEQAVKKLAEITGKKFEIEIISTVGDRVQDKPLTSFGGTGIFVKELEEALLSGKADIAVHSLKDVPTDQPKGLVLAAFPDREDSRDILLVKGGGSLENLKHGALVGTGSPRRRMQLLQERPDLKFAELRGNIDTRIKKLEAGDYDAIVLAAAGLNRLEKNILEESYMDIELMLPAPGQGMLVFECREDDIELIELLSKINNNNDKHCVLAERKFMETLEGGCKVPLAAYAFIEDDLLKLTCLAGDDVSARFLELESESSIADSLNMASDTALALKVMCKEENIKLALG